jgi:hypothetical protein
MFVLYSTLFHLPPLRFHYVVGGCCIEPRPVVASALALYNVKQRRRLELCASLAIRFLIVSSCTRWHRIFEDHSQNGGRADLSQNLCASLFRSTSTGSILLGRTFINGLIKFLFKILIFIINKLQKIEL